jgi:hypothetical protein
MTKPITKTQAAILSGRSVFANTVKSVSDGMAKSERAIKPSKNVKLGKIVTRGKLAGAKIYTLTLEERATCPDTCKHWSTCYGNNMYLATRYTVDASLLTQIEADLHFYNSKAKPFLVRLHVLGDFASIEYVAFWARMLGQFEHLNIYGYTARLKGTPIGDALLSLRSARFMVRQSGNHNARDMTALSFDDKSARAKVKNKTAFVCPTQITTRGEYILAKKDETTLAANCGACGLCWTAQKPVVFLTH